MKNNTSIKTKGYNFTFGAMLEGGFVSATTLTRAATKRAAESAARRRVVDELRNKANWSNQSFDGHVDLNDCTRADQATDYGRVTLSNE